MVKMNSKKETKIQNKTPSFEKATPLLCFWFPGLLGRSILQADKS